MNCDEPGLCPDVIRAHHGGNVSSLTPFARASAERIAMKSSDPAHSPDLRVLDWSGSIQYTTDLIRLHPRFTKTLNLYGRND